MNPGMQRSTMAESQSIHQVRLPGDPTVLTSGEGCEAGLSAQGSDQRAQIELMRSGPLSAVQRVAAGNELARLGDPRFRLDAWDLPDDALLGFVEIPPGPFLMGSDPGQDPSAYPDEIPPHEMHSAALLHRPLPRHRPAISSVYRPHWP